MGFHPNDLFTNGIFDALENRNALRRVPLPPHSPCAQVAVGNKVNSVITEVPLQRLVGAFSGNPVAYMRVHIPRAVGRWYIAGTYQYEIPNYCCFFYLLCHASCTMICMHFNGFSAVFLTLRLPVDGIPPHPAPTGQAVLVLLSGASFVRTSRR